MHSAPGRARALRSHGYARPDSAVLGALLDWYRAMGVDAALEEAPVDWLARQRDPARRRLPAFGG